MVRKFIQMKIIGYSKKFKSIKLKPQKSPKHSAKWHEIDADLKARAKFDSIFDAGKGSAESGFSKVGMGIFSTKHAAAQTLASRTAGKKWNRGLTKAIKKQRSTIASFAKTNKSKVSLRVIKKAKTKGFVSVLDKQDEQFERVRSSTQRLFTGSKGADPFKTYTKKTLKKFVSKEQLKNWGK